MFSVTSGTPSTWAVAAMARSIRRRLGFPPRRVTSAASCPQDAGDLGGYRYGIKGCLDHCESGGTPRPLAIVVGYKDAEVQLGN
ncbi:MAG: hypothetical protein M0Z47_01470 [Actinomycetota bacterium]|nr:hypothetical protein [Actinomycetota bacterium]